MRIWKAGRDVDLENSLIGGRKKYGERIAVTDSEDEISYMELKQKADCLAAAFLRKGILKGDKVLVQLPNRISFVIVFLRFPRLGRCQS